MATTTQAIQQLYVAYFNRPADPLGLAYWSGHVTNGLSLAAVAKEFATAPEYKAMYGGKNAQQVVTALYKNLFDRLPDDGGLAFWADGLDKGTYTVDDIVATVAASAQQDPARGPDTLMLESKVAAAANFTARVKPGQEVLDPNIATGSGKPFDASSFWDFQEFRFRSGGTVNKVASHQLLSTEASLTATSAKYTAAAGGLPDEGGAQPDSTRYGGTLYITATGDATLTARAEAVALTVTAKSGVASGDVDAALTGDVKSATVLLQNGVTTGHTYSKASITVSTATDVADIDHGTGAYTALGNLRSLTVSGNGEAFVTNQAGGKLALVDVSGLNSLSPGGVTLAGLSYSSSSAVAELIKLGASIDHITLSGSHYGGLGASEMDTVAGLHLVLNAAGTGLAPNSDLIDINNGALNAVAWKPSPRLQDLDLVLKDAAAAEAADATHNALVFHFQGSTYIFQDTIGEGQITEGDTVVKLTGELDLNTLIVALA